MAYQIGDTWRWNGSTWVLSGSLPLVTVRAGDLYVRDTEIPQFNVPQGTSFPVPNLGLSVNDEAHYLTRMPASYMGGQIVWDVAWCADAIVGNVNLEVSLCAIPAGGGQSILTKGYPAGVASESVVNGTANAPVVTSGALTGAALDGVAVGNLISIRLRRVAASTSEMAGDALALVLWLRQ